jgi:hypothetical protein
MNGAIAKFRNRRSEVAWLVCTTALLIVLVGCDSDSQLERPVTREDPVVPLDSGLVSIRTETDTLVLRVEIAETEDQVRIGLMERTALGRDEGTPRELSQLPS